MLAGLWAPIANRQLSTGSGRPKWPQGWLKSGLEKGHVEAKNMQNLAGIRICTVSGEKVTSSSDILVGLWAPRANPNLNTGSGRPKLPQGWLKSGLENGHVEAKKVAELGRD